MTFHNSKKQAGNDTNRFDNEINANIDNLLEYKCITPTQHKKVTEKVSLVKKMLLYTLNLPINFDKTYDFHLYKCLTYHNIMLLTDPF